MRKVQFVGISFLLLLTACFVGYQLFFRQKKENFRVESRVQKVKEFDASDVHGFKTIGWLRVQGTSLDVPVLYSTEGNYDITPDFGHYAWALNETGEFHNMMAVMGHNIFNLSNTPQIKSELFNHFEELMAFIYYDFAKDNQYIQLTLGEKEYVYKIFSVELVPRVDTTYFPTHEDYTEEDMEQQVNYFKSHSYYDYDVDVSKTDKILSLITCTRFYGLEQEVNFYVTGRLLRENEKITSYKVTKNEANYKEIEIVLKGDGENDEEV